MDDKPLFDVIRDIKGAGLTNEDVRRVKDAVAAMLADAPEAQALAPVVGYAGGMKISQRGIDFIHSFESLRLTAYPDPGSRDGLPVTNGWGTTVNEGGGRIKLGEVWDRAKADRLFARDIAAFEKDVNFLLAGKPTTQGQFDALVSFAYNAGSDIDDDTKAEGLGDSTLLRKHLAGDYAGAQAAFASWVYNDGQKMNGLIRRRAGEAALYAS